MPRSTLATLAFFFALTGASMAGVKYLANGDPAGGDLTGTYPDPTIRAWTVTGTRVADGAITGAKLGNITTALSQSEAIAHQDVGMAIAPVPRNEGRLGRVE